MRFPFTASKQSITVFVNGRQYVIGADHSGFRALSEHLKLPEHDAAVITDLVDKVKTVSRLTEGNVTVHGTTVYYKGVPVHGTLSDKLVSMLDEGYDAVPWALFMDNLHQNPSENSKAQLFDFLSSFNAPFTEDGCFVVFKRVRQDYTDVYSGKFDNSPGQVVEMPRENVVDDPNQTCAAGLHVCAISYLSSGWGCSGRTIAVKVNPADVVSVPKDYKFAKMRVCKYEVIGDIDEEGSGDVIYTTDQVANATYLDSKDPDAKGPLRVENGTGAVYEVEGFEVDMNAEPAEGEFAYHPETGRVGRVLAQYTVNYNDDAHPENKNWVNGDVAGYEVDPAEVYEIDFGDKVETIVMYEGDDTLVAAWKVEEEDDFDIDLSDSDDSLVDATYGADEDVLNNPVFEKNDTDTFTFTIDTPLADLVPTDDGTFDLFQSGVQIAKGLGGDEVMALVNGKNTLPMKFSVSGIPDPVSDDAPPAEPIELTARSGATMVMTPEEFYLELAALGQRGFDRKYNVPRTTIQEVLKRIKD